MRRDSATKGPAVPKGGAIKGADGGGREGDARRLRMVTTEKIVLTLFNRGDAEALHKLILHLVDEEMAAHARSA